MKRILIGLLALVLLGIAALIILPVVYKDDIVQLVKDEINERVDARVDFGDFDMSLLPHFPDFSFSIEQVSVVGIGDFEGDTLVSVGEIDLTFDLMSVIFGDEIEVKRVGIDRMNVMAKVLEDGRAGWDIGKGRDDGAGKVEGEEEGEGAAGAAPDSPGAESTAPQSTAGTKAPRTPAEPTARRKTAGGPPAEDDAEVAGTPFKVALRELRIQHSNIRYDDAEGGVHADLRDLDFSLQGDFSQDFSTLKTRSTISAATLSVGAIPYLNRARVDFRADIDADLANSKYTLRANELMLNELVLEWDGSVAVAGGEGDGSGKGGQGGPGQPGSGKGGDGSEPGEKAANTALDLDVRFSAKQTDVKTILSLIPVVYTRDFENVEASGKLTFDGFVRGRYSDDRIPSFGIRLFVEGGRVKYPDLPKSIDKIDVNLQVNNPGGELDRTIVNFSRFHVEIAGNPIDIRLVVKTPISDPEVFCQVNGKIDLASLGDVIPLEQGEKITGRVDADIRLQGKVSAIESRNYNAFQAVGGLSIEGMTYQSADQPKGISIDRANLQFSPQYVDLKSLECRIGRSDISAKGKVENFIPYAMTDNAVLEGRGELSSRLLDLGDFLSGEGEAGAMGTGTAATGAAKDTIPFSAIGVPRNVDLRIASSIDKIVYDRITVTQVKGNLKVKDQVLTLENLGMDVLGGKTTLSGTYDTRKPDEPKVNVDLNVARLDIPQAFRMFDTFQAIAPIAEHCTGIFSSTLKFSGILGRDMAPVLSSLTGNGELQTENAVVKNSGTLNQVADALKSDRFRQVQFRNLKLPFQFKDGRVHLKPTDVRLDKTDTTISGSHGFDQTLDYKMKMKIPASEFGASFNAFLGSVSSQLTKIGLGVDVAKMAEAVELELLIRGTVKKPTVTIGGLNLIGSGGKALVEQLTEELRKQMERIIQEAERRAQAIRDEARKAAEALRKEGYAQADRIQNEAKGKDPISQAAAKAAADKVRSETDKKADRLIKEADEKARKIIDEAQKEADSLGNG